MTPTLSKAGRRAVRGEAQDTATAPIEGARKTVPVIHKDGRKTVLGGERTSVPPKQRTKRPVTKAEPIIKFRPYQLPVFEDRTSGILVLHWSRQIGKSFTLASWAVDRCLTRPGRLVTVLSNSKDNGAEFAVKAAEVLRLLDKAFQALDGDSEVEPEAFRESEVEYDAMRFEIRIRVEGQTSRIKVLAANPRTARGFSGDLILDEFAFHENSAAIWEAAEPILSSNPDFLCRISSTGNGKHNLFYQMATSGKFPLSRVPRSLAWKQGVKIYDPKTREAITPDEARASSLDKRAYDQNYECAFTDENMALLTQELISTAERPDVGIICDQAWTASVIQMLYRAQDSLYCGLDIGRHHDLSVLSVFEKSGPLYLCRAILRMANMRLPAQQRQLDILCSLPRFRRVAIDMTGLGLGLFEYAEEKHGSSRIVGVNFSTSVPVTDRIQAEGRKANTVKVTEAMAVDLLGVYEDKRIQHPANQELRDDLRKPERVVSPGGKVSIAATRDGAGHADHFWSFALAIKAASGSHPFAYEAIEDPYAEEEVNL